MTGANGLETKLIIFDLGGVIFSHSFDVALRYWAEKAQANFTDIKSKFSHDHMYALHEVNKINIEEYKDHVCKELGIVLPLKDFIVGWNSIFLNEINGAPGILESLSKNYLVVALSNTNQTHCEFMRVKYSKVLKIFRKIYYSHEILERKPNRAAYQRVMDDFEVKGPETIFLDDLVQNVEGAEVVGIRTIHVTNFSSMVTGLEENGLLL